MQDTNVDCAKRCEAVRTVSVAIVAHNEAPHFSNILEDVVAQDFPHNRMELLLIDRMSKDDTKRVLLEFAEGDQAKDVTRFTDRVVGHMVSGIVKKMRQVLNKYVSITITDMTDLIPELTYYIRWAEYIE